MLQDINKLKKKVAELQLEMNDIRKILRKLMTIFDDVKSMTISTILHTYLPLIISLLILIPCILSLYL